MCANIDTLQEIHRIVTRLKFLCSVGHTHSGVQALPQPFTQSLGVKYNPLLMHTYIHTHIQTQLYMPLPHCERSKLLYLVTALPNALVSIPLSIQCAGYNIYPPLNVWILYPILVTLMSPLQFYTYVYTSYQCRQWSWRGGYGREW